jgi:hypothetical protein
MYTFGIMSNKAWFSILILSAGSSLLYGQAMIEYGASAGHSGAATGAINPGRSAVSVFQKVSKALGGAANADEAAKPGTQAPLSAAPAITPPATTTTSAAKPSAPEASPDFTALAAGMDRADLLKRVGKPSMTMSSVESSVLVETCWYRNGSDSVTVILRDGKVATISGMEKLSAK